MPTDDPSGLDRLAAAARDGDRVAFEELVRRTYVDTFTLAVRLTGNEEDAADVVQDTYIRAWKGMGRFRGDSQFSTWLYRVTANTAATHLRKRSRRRADPLDDVIDPPETRIDALPEASAETGALGERINGALDQLPTGLRAVVVLKDVYGLPHEAIAEELGISEAAAKVRLHRGRKRLQELLIAERREDGDAL